MKLADNFQPRPSGKGKVPATQKQADQFSYYDEITKAWKFPRPLTHSLIEKLNLLFTGRPRGIPLPVWREVIDKMNETPDIPNPFGYLRSMLMKRVGAGK